MSYHPDSMSQARMLMALNILAGNGPVPALPRATTLDEEQRAVVKSFTDVRTQGYGEIRVTVIASHLDTVYTTQVRKRRDFENQG